MKKTTSLFQIGVTVLLVLSTSACVSLDFEAKPWQGKVWRGLVNEQLVDTSSPTRESRNEKWVEHTKYRPDIDVGLRLNRVIIERGFDFVIVNAVVADQLEIGDMPRGTLVDVMTVKSSEADHGTANYTRVIAIVCQKDDAECMEREKKADRIRAVVDANPPADLNQRLGLTFNRRVTKEELKKYD